jgi:4'-phosphopantetheinyl transferase
MLQEGEAHVWRVMLSRVREGAAVLDRLSADERVRVERQRGGEARQRFIATRHALRHILAGYTGESPAAVELVIDARGKPGLAVERSLHFSVSHSGGLALIGVARAEVGVDVERLREPRRLLETARRILHAETVRTLEQLEGERRRTAFLDAWTQRESHVKAVGGGLFLTPDLLPFDAAQSADGAPHACVERSGEGEWTVVRFSPDGAARASLVARGRLTRVHYFDWNANNATGEGDE